MRYRLSRLVPIRFQSTYKVDISKVEVEEGGHGNHFHGDAHNDAEHASWWQWRDRIWRRRTVRVCLEIPSG